MGYVSVANRSDSAWPSQPDGWGHTGRPKALVGSRRGHPQEFIAGLGVDVRKALRRVEAPRPRTQIHERNRLSESPRTRQGQGRSCIDTLEVMQELSMKKPSARTIRLPERRKIIGGGRSHNASTEESTHGSRRIDESTRWNTNPRFGTAELNGLVSAENRIGESRLDGQDDHPAWIEPNAIDSSLTHFASSHPSDRQSASLAAVQDVQGVLHGSPGAQAWTALDDLASSPLTDHPDLSDGLAIRALGGRARRRCEHRLDPPVGWRRIGPAGRPARDSATCGHDRRRIRPALRVGWPLRVPSR